MRSAFFICLETFYYLTKTLETFETLFRGRFYGKLFRRNNYLLLLQQIVSKKHCFAYKMFRRNNLNLLNVKKCSDETILSNKYI